MRATSLGEAPLLSKICQAISLSTESKALAKSSTQSGESRLCPKSHLRRRRKLNRASTVLLLGLKPHCLSRNLSASHCSCTQHAGIGFPVMLCRAMV